MYDTATGRHELQVSGIDGSGVASEVFVVHGSREEVGDGLLSAVGVVGETGTRRNGEVILHTNSMSAHIPGGHRWG